MTNFNKRYITLSRKVSDEEIENRQLYKQNGTGGSNTRFVNGLSEPIIVVDELGVEQTIQPTQGHNRNSNVVYITKMYIEGPDVKHRAPVEKVEVDVKTGEKVIINKDVVDYARQLERNDWINNKRGFDDPQYKKYILKRIDKEQFDEKGGCVYLQDFCVSISLESADKILENPWQTKTWKEKMLDGISIKDLEQIGYTVFKVDKHDTTGKHYTNILGEACEIKELDHHKAMTMDDGFYINYVKDNGKLEARLEPLDSKDLRKLFIFSSYDEARMGGDIKTFQERELTLLKSSNSKEEYDRKLREQDRTEMLATMQHQVNSQAHLQKMQQLTASNNKSSLNDTLALSLTVGGLLAGVFGHKLKLKV